MLQYYDPTEYKAKGLWTKENPLLTLDIHISWYNQNTLRSNRDPIMFNHL